MKWSPIALVSKTFFPTLLTPFIGGARRVWKTQKKLIFKNYVLKEKWNLPLVPKVQSHYEAWFLPFLCRNIIWIDLLMYQVPVGGLRSSQQGGIIICGKTWGFSWTNNQQNHFLRMTAIFCFLQKEDLDRKETKRKQLNEWNGHLLHFF